MALTEDIKQHHDIIERISIIKSNDLDSDELFLPFVREKSSTILRYHHSFLLNISNTISAAFMQFFIVFIPFIFDEYSFSYPFMMQSMAIGSLSTIISIAIVPLFLRCRSNICCAAIYILSCLGTFILWQYRHHAIAFIVGMSSIFNAYQLQWSAANAMIHAFVHPNDTHKSHIYLSSLSFGWVLSAFLFIGIGFILTHFSFELFLKFTFLIFAGLALLNLLILPKRSVIGNNAWQHQASSIKHELKILFGLQTYRLIILTLMLMMTAWSFFYISFGIWIQQMYALTQAQFGIAVALMEGIGNLTAVLGISCLAKNDNLRKMVIYFSLLSMLSMGGYYCVYVEHMLMDYAWMIYALFSLFFCGSEGVTVSLMLLSGGQIPKSLQKRSDMIVSIMYSVCSCVGRICAAFAYENDGMAVPVLFCSKIVLVMMVIYLTHVVKQNKLQSEMLSINQHLGLMYT